MEQVSLVGDEEVITLSHAKVYVFSATVLCLGKLNENPQSNTDWEDKLTWFKKVHHNSDIRTQLMVSQWNPSGIFPRIHHSAALQQIFKSSFSKMSEEPENLQDGSSSCRCSTTPPGDLKTMNRNAN